MIPLAKFLQCVQENAARVREYAQGCDGSGGKCDCIGLIIGALGLAGFRWPGVHGSNWAARNAMNGLGCVENAGELFPGEIVYKAKEPGEEGYSLPDRYRDSGDLLDYYHVGVVTGTDPLEITHCTDVPGGIKRDGKLGSWRFGGKLIYVDYAEGGGEAVERQWATVYAENGKPVNLRKQPDRSSTILARVPVGEAAEVLEDAGGEWAKVAWNGKTGYMMKQFLLIEPDGDEPEENTVRVPRELLETWADALDEAVRNIRELIGQGQGQL